MRNLFGVRRVLFLFTAGSLLAGCGGSSTTATKPSAPRPDAAPRPASALGTGARTLYAAGGWAVVTRGTTAVAAHFTGSAWQPDRSGAVRIRIIAPRGTVDSRPQVAAELSASRPLVESALWVDGHELLEKGGGLKPNKGTIYGAPDRRLAPGRHVVVAYARTATAGTAVTWSFRVS